MVSLSRSLVPLALLAVLAAPGYAEDAGMTRAQAFVRAAALQAVGRAMFFDPSLSASGQMACSSCHDPAHGFGPPNALDVQIGGKDLKQPGLRAVPSLTYLQGRPAVHRALLRVRRRRRRQGR